MTDTNSIVLGGRDYREETIQEKDFGEVGNRHPSLVAWAIGESGQELTHGHMPEDLAEIRGEWDSAWSSK